MTSTFIFAGFPLSLNLIGQFLEIKRPDKTGAKVVNRVRQKHRDFAAVLSGKIKHARMRRVITNHTAGGKLLSQSLRYRQRLNASNKHPAGVKIFEPLFSPNIINYLLHAQSEKGAAGPGRQTHKALRFIENSLCFLRHFFIRLNPTGYWPNKLAANPEGRTTASRAHRNSQGSCLVKIAQVENVNRFKRDRTVSVVLAQSVIRWPGAFEDRARGKSNRDTTMRTDVRIRERHHDLRKKLF